MMVPISRDYARELKAGTAILPKAEMNPPRPWAADKYDRFFKNLKTQLSAR